MQREEYFCLLETSSEEYKRRTFAFSAACVIETVAVVLLAFACAWYPHWVPERPTTHYALITLPSLAEQKPLPQPKPILKPPPAPQYVAPQIQPVITPAPAPRVETARIERPPAPAKLPEFKAPRRPEPMTEAFAAHAPAVSHPAAPVHTGLFGQAMAGLSGEKPRPKAVETAGFGDPQGLPGHATGPGNVAKLGSFDGPAGVDTKPQQSPHAVAIAGFGGGDQYSVSETDSRSRRPVGDAGFGGGQQYTVTDTEDRVGRKTVASAGFGAGGVPGGTGTGTGQTAPVKTGAFGTTPVAPKAASTPAPPPAPKTQPVEILSKPSPQYTEEARRLRVQGEVVLSVVFQANGTLKVVAVVKSLGHGLDEMAEQAASQIRFRPAQQADKPMDFPATLHIEFRLA
jgi:TonB family protein